MSVTKHERREVRQVDGRRGADECARCGLCDDDGRLDEVPCAPRPLVLTPVAPIGTSRGAAFVDYADGRGGIEMVESPVYPEGRGAEMRELRVHGLDLSLREAARALGLSAMDLSSIERGSATTDFDEMARRLRALRPADYQPRPRPAPLPLPPGFREDA